MGLHPAAIIFEYEGCDARVTKHLLSHSGINLIIENLNDCYF
jgi:hypothetical protein